MKFIEKILNSVKPRFEKGSFLEFVYPVFEMVEGFLLTTGKVTTGKTHIRDGLESKRLMSMVILALIPCTVAALYNIGLQRSLATGEEISVIRAFEYGLQAFMPLYIVTVVTGGLWEVLFAVVRKHEINEGFFVTSLLFPLILPPTLPLWQAAVAISFGVVIGKEVFGGTGMNILNPALLARAFLFFSYPGEMSGGGIWTFVNKSRDTIVDGFSGATPLAVASAVEKGGSVVQHLNSAGYTFEKLFIGNIPGSMGETSALACLIGAAILIFSRIASWRTMAGSVIGALGVSALMYFFGDKSSNPMFGIPPYYHLVLGGFAFGTVFMATDPVTSAATRGGKWIYGILIGALAITIRCVNPVYPEGMMLAILFMNVFAPLIDHFTAAINIRRRAGRGTR